jgi:SAM-dependent methyltransferase
VTKSTRPTWQLPPGVTRGAWDYVNEPSIATEYDTFHAGHPLLDLDQQLIAQQLGSEPIRADGQRKVVVDFGCGTGRNLIPMALLGWHVVGVDLSLSMLEQFRTKLAGLAGTHPLAGEPALIHANMATSHCFDAQFADAVLCMYSSLGMVHGRRHRRAFLSNVGRMLRADGQFIVHVHNRGSWLRDPGGIRRSFSDWIRSKRDPNWEFGDRVYAYRGLPSMFLHIYSERELVQDIHQSGLVVRKMVRLNRQSSAVLKSSWIPHLQSGGFIAICGH